MMMAHPSSPVVVVYSERCMCMYGEYSCRLELVRCVTDRGGGLAVVGSGRGCGVGEPPGAAGAA
jgi:hypothetical protein